MIFMMLFLKLRFYVTPKIGGIFNYEVFVSILFLLFYLRSPYFYYF